MTRKWAKWAALAAVLAAAAWGAWQSMGDLSLVDARLKKWPRSAVVKDQRGRILSAFLSEDREYCLPVPLSAMGRWLPLLTVEIEDRRFRSHRGVDWLGLGRAVVDNLRGRRTGASTLSSQVIRIGCPSARTLKTKLREFSQAQALERRLSKDQILELYLNRVPMGSNVRGVEAAAWSWFGRSAADVSLGQAALLVSMFKGPTAYRPDLHPSLAKKRRDLLLNVLKGRGLINASQLEMAVAEPLPGVPRSLPSESWQFCRKVLAVTGRQEVVSTLNREYQRYVDSALNSALAGQSQNVTAAAVLIENDSGAVRAYSANARWGADQEGSWVDCADSRRSPGSTLKPFVYAMAFEGGLISPASLLADTPLVLSGRAPRNFDRSYRGPVDAGTALVDSLNAPAVRILRRVEGSRFLQRLRLLGLDGLDKSADFYGDSLVLGGCEVSPLEMARAFSALARRGRVVSPVFVNGEKGHDNDLFSAESAWLTTKILADASRLPVLLRSIDKLRGHVAFKTGTSYGLRDAWTVGWNRRWTLVVWLGDPTGMPHDELVGLSAAAPAVLSVFRQLPESDIGDQPAGVGLREVCPLSGLPGSPVCPEPLKELYIQGISPSSICRLHRIEDGRRVILWPPELAEFMAGTRESGSTLTVTNPHEGASYLLHEKGARLIFKAEGGKERHWYVDGVYVGSEGSYPCLWTMTPGAHHATVMDERGRSSSVNFKVVPLTGNRRPDLEELQEIDK